MASFWEQHAPGAQDFNLGGFQPAPSGGTGQFQGINGGPVTNYQTIGGVDSGNMWSPNGDPRLTTQPQPYQQGPVDPAFNIGTDAERDAQQKQLYADFEKMGGKIQPGPYGREWTPGGGPGTLQGPMDMQHIMGIIGAGAGGIGNMMRGQPMNTAQQDVARQALPSGGAFGGGIAIGPNGGFINPGDGSPYQGGMSAMGPQQPMNPGQQSGQVQMQAPDGTMQYVNQEHVPHYQGLGATVMNGSSYGGG